MAERGFFVTSRDYWRFIKGLFPPNTGFFFFRDIRNGDLCIRISQRASKHSRIVLRIREEDLDDYLYVDAPRRHDAERGLAEYVARQLEAPTHDEWVVPSEILKGEGMLVR